MPIVIYCTRCSAKLQVPDSKVGRSASCPRCKSDFVVNRSDSGLVYITPGTSTLPVQVNLPVSDSGSLPVARRAQSASTGTSSVALPIAQRAKQNSEVSLTSQLGVGDDSTTGYDAVASQQSGFPRSGNVSDSDAPPFGGASGVVPQHPDEVAFQAAIDTAPLDRLPRLVFCDWLEEHGDMRAEGYRILAEFDRWPWYNGKHFLWSTTYKYRSHRWLWDNTGWWRRFSTPSNPCGGCNELPEEWWIPDTPLSGQMLSRSLRIGPPGGGRPFFATRRDAMDFAAQAWSELTLERRTICLEDLRRVVDIQQHGPPKPENGKRRPCSVCGTRYPINPTGVCYKCK